MMSSKWILAIWLAASASWAQTLPPSALTGAEKAAMSAAQAAGRAGTGQPQPATPPARPSQRPSAPASSAAQVSAAHVSAAKVKVRHSATVAKQADEQHKPSPGGRAPRKGQRDPFVSPLVEHNPGGHCTGTGRQCLYVGDIALQGVVRYPGGFIAVVMSGDHTYFLHDHDPLADGDVERITSDAIILRQHSTDILGRPLVREVTRKLGAPAA